MYELLNINAQRPDLTTQLLLRGAERADDTHPRRKKGEGARESVELGGEVAGEGGEGLEGALT